MIGVALEHSACLLSTHSGRGHPLSLDIEQEYENETDGKVLAVALLLPAEANFGDNWRR